ncbi:FAD-dependent oxidoreductase [Ktedonospora formicarum]|uniref:FHA domain-containing protein n=1 Tax=Ktedonospora formicarum TaxID=2778364 RepID=A0A8J3I199_9CHLR|nr:FAD-dependent oxidoreductase [Ktedonospora formicarum]GHO44223.1 hypothetical protein KSX_23860 [Ktedonospora formicarum]
MSKQAGTKYVIIGSGIAAVTAAEVLRSEDPLASIIMLGDTAQAVYYRPALKDYLAGRISDEKLPARSEQFYREQNIRYYADPAISIDTQKQYVQLKSGRKVSYHRLLLACGAQPARLTCPGSELDGVITLRDIDDYQEVLSRLPKARNIVVCGSGTLALETVEALRQRGHEVTHLIRKQTLWSEVLDPTASDLIIQQELRDGVRVHREEEIVEIRGQRGRVHTLRTSSDVTLPCDLLICAIGIEPNLECIQGNGIAHKRGVHVNTWMRTSAPNVYAAGDVVEMQDPFNGRMRVLGQWYPAIQQARTAAYSMLGLLDPQQDPQAPLSNSLNFYNATFLYGLPFAATGVTNLSGSQGLQEIIAEPEPHSYRKVLLKDGQPIGMLALGKRSQALAFKRAIDHQVQLATIALCLFMPDFNLQDWLDNKGVPPPLLGLTVRRPKPKVEALSASVEQPVQETTPDPDTAPFPMTTQSVQDTETPQYSEWYLVPQINQLQMEGVSPLRLSRSEKLTVGRQPGSHLLLDMETISRLHAEIFHLDGRFVLRDLGSTNGIFINGRRLPPNAVHFLQENEEISFGSRARFLVMSHTRTEPDTAPLRKLQLPHMGVDGNTGGLMKRFAALNSGYIAQTEKMPALQILTDWVERGNEPNSSPPLSGLTICRCCGVANTQKARFCASCSASLEAHSEVMPEINGGR